MAFRETAKARAALDSKRLAIVNLDVPLTVSRVLGAVMNLHPLRDELVSHLPRFDIRKFDKLETYAHALAHAHVAYLTAIEPRSKLPALVARAMKLRALFLGDARALANRNLLDGRVLKRLSGSSGYRNVSGDLGVLLALFREHRDVIASRSAIQRAELEEAEQLFVEMMRTARKRDGKHGAEATDDRARAFTLVLDAYDQARRAVTYLRWNENDVEKLAPSLWTGRGKRKRVSKPVGATPQLPRAQGELTPVHSIPFSVGSTALLGRPTSTD